MRRLDTCLRIKKNVNSRSGEVKKERRETEENQRRNKRIKGREIKIKGNKEVRETGRETRRGRGRVLSSWCGPLIMENDTRVSVSWEENESRACVGWAHVYIYTYVQALERYILLELRVRGGLKMADALMNWY